MLNDLILYRKYSDFIYYVYILIDKLPRKEREAIGIDIRKYLIINYELIIKYYDNKLVSYLNNINVNMLILNNLIRVIYKRKYISIKNYNAYVKKSGEIVKISKGLIKYEETKV